MNAFNSSSSGSGGRKAQSSRPAQAMVAVRSYLKNKIMKKENSLTQTVDSIYIFKTLVIKIYLTNSQF
jgi:hypothetical protein